MPVTPFHMGPGLLAKALLGRHLSLMVFGFSQVAIDLEPLVHIVRGDAVLHGFAHTYVGATLVASFSVVAGRPICQRLLARWTPDVSDATGSAAVARTASDNPDRDPRRASRRATRPA